MPQELLTKVRELLGDAVIDTHAKLGDATVLVDAGRIVEVLRTLRDSQLRFNFLMDLTAVDYLGRDPRFEIVYHLSSLAHNHSLVLKVRADHESPEVPSVCGVWQGANLQEREAYDLLGIQFSGHPNLKRMLLWEGFPGHPLRKDFMSLQGGVSPGLRRFPKEDPEQWGGEFRAD